MSSKNKLGHRWHILWSKYNYESHEYLSIISPRTSDAYMRHWTYYQNKKTYCKRKCRIKCLPCVTKEASIYTDRLTNNWLCITCISMALPFTHRVEENDFMDALSESWMSHCKNRYFTFESLLEKAFNPFELDDGKVQCLWVILTLAYIFLMIWQQVIIFLTLIIMSRMTLSVSVSDNDSCFSVIHMNIRSIPRTLHEFEAYPHCLDFDFTVIALTETWFTDSTAEMYGLTGYYHEIQYRKDQKGGGVSLLIKENIEYVTRNNFSEFNSHIESLFIELHASQFNLNKCIIVI